MSHQPHAQQPLPGSGENWNDTALLVRMQTALLAIARVASEAKFHDGSLGKFEQIEQLAREALP